MNDIWQKVGAVSAGGTVSAITGTTPLWLGTEAGIFLRDNNDTWRPLSQGQPLPQLGALAAHDQILLVGNNQGQIVYSRNGGDRWYQGLIKNVAAPISWITLAPDFAERGLALAGTVGAGILRTTDGGKTWQAANFGLQDFSMLALAAPPAWGRRESIFAASEEAFYRSINGGRAWKLSNSGLEGAIVQAVKVSPNYENDKSVFVGTETNGVFRSKDGGRKWQPCNQGIPLTGEGEFPPVNAIWLHPDFGATPDCVIATGDGRLFYSHDGGDQWQQASAPDAVFLCLGGDRERLYAGSYNRGLFESDDGGQTWTEVSQLAARLVTRLHVTGQSMYAFGPLGQLWCSTSEGREWQPKTFPPDTPLLMLNAATGNDKTCLLAATPTGLLRSDSETEDWQSVLEEAEVLAIHFSSEFAADGKVWVGTSAGKLYVSADRGLTWSERSGPQPQKSIVFISSTRNQLVAATFSASNGQMILWRSADSGEKWTQWHQANTSWPSVQMDWIDSTAVVCLDRRCWISGAAGWERVLETEQPIVRLLRLRNDSRMLVLTPGQVYLSVDGRRWIPWDEGLPQATLLDLAVSPGQTATVVTTGGIIWQRDI
jgi:photosystem II stability/assembly factor-like uncharacterized protein